MITFIKSIKNKAFRTSFLQGFKIYWETLHVWERLKFDVTRKRFMSGQWFMSKYQSISILWFFFNKAFWNVIRAILLIGFLSVIERYTPLTQLSLMKDDSFIGTYGVLAQISGLILALYFTTMSILVSTIYSKVPDNIRNLIAREKVGGGYIGLLMCLSATALIELGAILYGKDPSLMVLFVVLLMSLMALLTLHILIHNIFHFFNPMQLAKAYIFPEAINWARKATYGHPGWDSSHFQYHCYEQVNQRLSIYKNIVDLLIEDTNSNNASLTSLMIMELSFLSLYTKIKNQIPTDSRWYEYQAEHPKWFETNSSSADISMKANIPLLHQEKPNHLWVEERVTNNLRVILSHLLKKRDYEHAHQLVQKLQESCTIIAKAFALKEAYFLTSVYDELILEYLPTAALDEKNKTYQLALADFYGANHVNIPIECEKMLEEISPDILRKKIQLINWKKPASVYKSNFPVSILLSIEHILQLKQNQLIVDKSVKVPEWYDLEIIAIECLKFLHETTEEVISQYEKAFTDKVRAIKGQDARFSMMQILTRGLEGYSKCLRFLSIAESFDKGLHNLILVKEIPHPTLEWSKHKKRIKDVRSKVIEGFGSFALAINPKDIDKSIPDYIGHAYWLFAQECFFALCEQDEKRYKVAYPTYMVLMDQMWEELSSVLQKGKDIEYYSSVLSEIFIDAMAIGGYAKLFNEFREGNYWKITVDVWDAYLKSPEREDTDVLNVFLSIAEYKSNPFQPSITSRNIERTGWEQKYNHIVKNEVGLSDDYFYHMQNQNARHLVKSALVRAFGASFRMYHAENVFIYSYILQKPEMKNAEVDIRTKQFIESFESTLRNDENANGR